MTNMDSSTKALLSDDLEKDQEIIEQPLPRRRLSQLLQAIRHVSERPQSFLLSLASVLILVLLWDGICQRRNAWHRCMQDTATPSPVLDLSPNYKTVKFNGSFTPDTIWRQPPGPEIDQMWRSIVRTDEVPVSFDDIRAMGKVPEDMKRVPPALRSEYGDSVLAIVEFGHQLHCLNLIRKYTFLDYYQDELLSENANMEVLRTHVDHCIDLVRQALMCYADPGFVTSYWIEGRKIAMPDFSTVHKCRNIDDIMGWIDTHKIDRDIHEPGPFPDEKVWTRQHHP